MTACHSLVLIGRVVSGERIRIVVVKIIAGVRILEETEFWVTNLQDFDFISVLQNILSVLTDEQVR